MSQFKVTVTLYPTKDHVQPLEVDLLVGTGAMFTCVPRSVLDGLGVQPIEKHHFRTADGGSAEREIGVVRLTIEGHEPPAPVPVLFGELDGGPVLGVTTLGSMGLTVDPGAGVLHPTDLLMLGVRP